MMLSVIMEYKFEGRAQLYMFRALQMMNLIPIIPFALLVSKLYIFICGIQLVKDPSRTILLPYMFQFIYLSFQPST